KETGQVTYDPGFMNTANAKSSITYIDGDEGILRYRGYPIEQLAEKSSYLEVAYLLINGELPTKGQLDNFEAQVERRTLLPARRPPDGGAAGRGVGPVDLLPGLPGPLRRGAGADLLRAPAGEDADDGRLRAPHRAGPCAALPRQPALPHRELPAPDLRLPGR